MASWTWPAGPTDPSVAAPSRSVRAAGAASTDLIDGGDDLRDRGPDGVAIASGERGSRKDGAADADGYRTGGEERSCVAGVDATRAHEADFCERLPQGHEVIRAEWPGGGELVD